MISKKDEEKRKKNENSGVVFFGCTNSSATLNNLLFVNMKWRKCGKSLYEQRDIHIPGVRTVRAVSMTTVGTHGLGSKLVVSDLPPRSVHAPACTFNPNSNGKFYLFL